RAVTTTFAPRSPAPRAIARPSPLEAPVTRTTCSASGFFRWPTGRSYPNALRLTHAGDRNLGADHPSRRRPSRLRAEALARDRALTRSRNARVQGFGHRPGRQGRAPAAAVRGRVQATAVVAPWVGFRGACATAKRPPS